MEAFVGLRPKGLETRHLDGDPSNNQLSNLAYGTSSENHLDMVRHGTHAFSSRTHCDQGHEYTIKNTHVRKSGARLCRACLKDRSQAWRDRQ
jgi:hypothetical protein